MKENIKETMYLEFYYIIKYYYIYRNYFQYYSLFLTQNNFTKEIGAFEPIQFKFNYST